MDKDKFTKTFKELLPYLITIVVILLFKQFLYCPVRVNGSSMYSTLKENDIMILNRIHYRFNDINRFDIVVVDAEDELLIKRVIGLPGEEIKYKNNKLYIDGKKLDNKYGKGQTNDFVDYCQKGYYFVMGDNRTNSLDSRILGSFKTKKLLGKTNYTIFPFSRFGKKE